MLKDFKKLLGIVALGVGLMASGARAQIATPPLVPVIGSSGASQLQSRQIAAGAGANHGAFETPSMVPGNVMNAVWPRLNGQVVSSGLPGSTLTSPSPASTPFQIPDLTKRENLSPALQLVVLLTVLSLVPSILLMMTCFTRFVIVLSLLRQALGTQQLPPNQVLVGLALFMTFVVMGPTIARVNNEALQPYMDGKIEQKVALERALVPIRGFMAKQIEVSDNVADVDLFMKFSKLPQAKTWDDVPTMSLIPAFMLSELKTAFLIGFKVYLPFLVIDMVISAVLISMGMMMLPPVLISLPFKLLLFVLVDGWHLVAGSLMSSFAQ